MSISELANQAVQLIDQLGNELQEIELNIEPDGSPDDIALIRERLERWKNRAVSNISEHINPAEGKKLKDRHMSSFSLFDKIGNLEEEIGLYFGFLKALEEEIESHPENILSVNILEETTKGEDIQMSESTKTWEAIEKEYDMTKNKFGRKINFVSDNFRRTIIFRDVEQSFTLSSLGFSKPAVILAGGVIEELLRLYLDHKNIKPNSTNFDDYIAACIEHKLLKPGVINLSNSVRHFRNLVHLSVEKSQQLTISKATAKGAVSSIFTIANDF